MIRDGRAAGVPECQLATVGQVIEPQHGSASRARTVNCPPDEVVGGAPTRSAPFGDLVDVVGEKAVCRAVGLVDGCRRWCLGETDDGSAVFVHPVLQEADAELVLDREVLGMNLGDELVWKQPAAGPRLRCGPSTTA